MMKAVFLTEGIFWQSSRMRDFWKDFFIWRNFPAFWGIFKLFGYLRFTLAWKESIKISGKFQQTVTLSRLVIKFSKKKQKKNPRNFQKLDKMSIRDSGTVEKITQKFKKSIRVIFVMQSNKRYTKSEDKILQKPFR